MLGFTTVLPKCTEEKNIILNVLKHTCGHPPNVVEVCETNERDLKIIIWA